MTQPCNLSDRRLLQKIELVSEALISCEVCSFFLVFSKICSDWHRRDWGYNFSYGIGRFNNVFAFSGDIRLSRLFSRQIQYETIQL